MKPVRTSSRIAFQFALFTAGSTLLILLFINISFFVSWYRLDHNYLTNIAVQQNRLQAARAALLKNNRRFIMPLNIQEQVPPPMPDEVQDEENGTVNYSSKLVNIIHANDDHWYMMFTDTQGKILLDITENVNRQRDLAAVSIVVLGIIGLTGYWISKRLVARGLKDLYTLADGVKASHIENLHTKLTIDHLPIDDEINIVATAIDTMKRKLDKQIQSIRDFVSHVSHEFKTPLMVMRSDIDLAQKTKEYDELIEKNMQSVQQMQTLLDGLLVLTTAQTGRLEKTDVNMSMLVERVCETMKKKYMDKDVIVHKHIAPHILIAAHQWAAESVISNVLDNAYKYTPEGGEITVILTEKECIVADTWIGIAQEHRDHIRQPFWQVDKNRQDGVWLGLSIVQKLGEVLWWTVKLEDNEKNWDKTQWTKISFIFPH